MRNKLMITAAGSLLAVTLSVGAIAGIAQAQPGGQPQQPQQPGGQGRAPSVDEFINRLAQNLGVTPDRLREALKQTALQQVDAAVAAGRLTPEEAQRARDRINSGTFPGFGPGFGRGGPGGALRVSHQGLAEFLGITPQQLRTEVQGKSLAQVAQAHGKTRDQLKQFIVSSAQTRLAEAVRTGRLTQQQADRMLDELNRNLDQMVDRVHDTSGRGPGRRQR